MKKQRCISGKLVLVFKKSVYMNYIGTASICDPAPVFSPWELQLTPLAGTFIKVKADYNTHQCMHRWKSALAIHNASPMNEHRSSFYELEVQKKKSTKA